MIYSSASNGKVSISVKSEKSLRKKCPYSELFWSAFSRIRYRVSLRIQSECGKMHTRINTNTDTFQVVSDE